MSQTINTIKFQLQQNIPSRNFYVESKFSVPENTYSISIQVETVKDVQMTFMVYDSNHHLRAQFWKGIEERNVIIHENLKYTSPYTISGEIPAGLSSIEIVCTSKEEIEANAIWGNVVISFNEETAESIKSDRCHWQNPNFTELNLTNFDIDKVFNTEKKWYKGDFHTHTIFSDGKMTREEIIESAANQNLDFFVVTDHNIVPVSWYDDTDILVIPGVEVTAPLGHFNLLCTKVSPFNNHRLIDLHSEEGMLNLMKSEYGSGLVSINHPFLSEWKWLFEKTPMDIIDSIEICNDPTYSDNTEATEKALLAWNLLLNDGYRVTGIGGSDSHLKPTETYEGSTQPSLIGDPGTFVYCNGLTAANVIEGIRNGHVVVSREEFIHFQVNKCMPGEWCEHLSGTAKASVDTDEPIYFEWIVDGKVVKKEDGNHSEYTFNFLDKEYHWIRVDVRYRDGSFYGFSNPVYFGQKKQPSIRYWGKVLEWMKEHSND
ncbi:CehA/McbA family metallohydrolase [Ureibacillus thermosphaericus]|uniref:CehA/McbA family metallohydrolase n=1 Tax=Ureibacillus thermosphaericus TaxID=51173 RepID=UPI0030CA092E